MTIISVKSVFVGSYLKISPHLFSTSKVRENEKTQREGDSIKYKRTQREVEKSRNKARSLL